MWGRWTTISLGGVFLVLLVIGLLFSFAPLFIGIGLALIIGAGMLVGMLVGRSTSGTEDPRPPRRPSPEAMSAERSPSRSNKPPTAP